MNFLKRAALSAVLVGAVSFAVSSPVHAQAKPAKAEAVSIGDANKARLRMFFEDVVNKKNMALFDDFVGKTMVDHQEVPGYTPDRAGVLKFFTDMTTAFPDLKVTVDLLVAEGDLVSALSTWTGTHKGAFMGAPASGKTVTFKVMDIVRIKDGKAVEHWGVSEDLALMTQLGLVHMGH